MTVTPMPGAEPVEIVEPDWSEFTPVEIEQRDAAAAFRLAVVDLRAAGTLSAAVAPALLRYGIMSAIHARAARSVFREGAVIKRAGGRVPAWNPNFSVMKQTCGMCSALESELGLSPRRRGDATPAKKTTRRQTAAETWKAGAAHSAEGPLTGP